MGARLTSKKYRRTTIELEEALYKRVKALAVEKDTTLREIISEALEEKLKQEEEKMESKNSDILSNPFARKIIREMEKFISRDAAVLLLRSKCEKRGIDPAKIDEEALNDEFIESLCGSMRYLCEIGEDECIAMLKRCRDGR